jgi:hypothetical protein
MDRRRMVLAAGVLVVAWLAVALGLIPRYMDGTWLDPTAANTVPFVLFDTATIETEAQRTRYCRGSKGLCCSLDWSMRMGRPCWIDRSNGRLIGNRSRRVATPSRCTGVHAWGTADGSMASPRSVNRT